MIELQWIFLLYIDIEMNDRFKTIVKGEKVWQNKIYTTMKYSLRISKTNVGMKLILTIDMDYIKELENSADDLSEIESKYIQFWIDEMRASISKYIQYLSDEDKAVFEKNQDDWEKTSIENLNFERDILTDSGYKFKQPSSFLCLWLSELRETYKQRTIRIKYLTYLFEQNLSDNNSAHIEFYYNKN